MKHIKTIYQQNITNNQVTLKSIKKQLFLSSMVRLVTFILAFYVVMSYFENTTLVISVIVGWIVLFLLMLSKHSDLQNKKKYLLSLIELNKNELKALDNDLSAFNTGDIYKNPSHYFSYDIDLFGDHSFFHHINRTKRKESEQLLANMLVSNDIKNVENKQVAIKELTQHLEWRQNYTVSTNLIESQVSSNAIFEWLSDYKPFISKFFYGLSVIFPFISLAVFGIYFWGFIPETFLLYLLLIGLGLTSIKLKQINLLSQHASEFKDIMSQYSNLLVEIENQKFESDLLRDKQKYILDRQRDKASKVLKEFSKYIDALDQRNNLLFGFIGNGYLLWDYKQVFKIEKWIVKHQKDVKSWFDTIEFFDAYNSLANFAYNHPTFVYPNIINYSVIEAKGLGHFMIDDSKRVSNDFKIDKNEFIIITGANMAGKSTFLRTIALNIVSANVGLPVCAKSFNYSPIKLISSMRTSDSLLDDESYFFSELKRLKFIVDEIQKDEYFIILDEILKGTNSKDKEEGSKKFIKKLVTSKSTGIIATHDLGLCKLSDELPQVFNKYFDAEIINDELYFDYTYKNGVCQNMNASFLLKKMGIVDK
jgi:ABC-type multidrug transport system fused ATPase/permease subunit